MQTLGKHPTASAVYLDVGRIPEIKTTLYVRTAETMQVQEVPRIFLRLSIKFLQLQFCTRPHGRVAFKWRLITPQKK